jgi:hypothetical protein
MVAMMLLRPLLFSLSWLQNGHVMSMQPVPWPDPDPVVAAAIGAMYGSRKTEPPLAVTVRDRLGEWLRDEEFAAAFGIRGRPGWPPSRLALVTVLQRAENLTGRMAAEAVRTGWTGSTCSACPWKTLGSTTRCCRNSGRRSRTRGWSRCHWTRC